MTTARLFRLLTAVAIAIAVAIAVWSVLRLRSKRAVESIVRQEQETLARLDRLRREYDERQRLLREAIEDAGDAGWLCDRLPCNLGDTIRPHPDKTLPHQPEEPADLRGRRDILRPR